MNKPEAFEEIDSLFEEWNTLKIGAKHGDLSDKPEELRAALQARAAAALDRLAPNGSFYKRNLQDILAKKTFVGGQIAQILGSLKALRTDIERGRLSSFTEIVRADTFASFLDMTDHLVERGYKDAAAVIAGSTLEQHLRHLSTKNDIPVRTPEGKFKKAESLNTDLAAKDVYTKLDQKAVTSWLGLRNEAAHGNYASYTIEQVRYMSESIRDFARRFSA